MNNTEMGGGGVFTVDLEIDRYRLNVNIGKVSQKMSNFTLIITQPSVRFIT